MPTWARRGLLSGLLAILVLLLAPLPAASAHAELLSTSPADGQRLDRAPAKVTFTFTEDVNLISGGIRLVDETGHTVSTPEPKASGATVDWPMPTSLRQGSYVVTWRVISADGHPVAGALSFGVGVQAGVVGAQPTRPGETAAWPVVVIRFAGYLAFALLVGALLFVIWCSPDSRNDPTLQRLARIGLLGGAASTVAALLAEGPYATGGAWTSSFDLTLLEHTAATPFGTALLWRLALYGALFFGVWMLEWLEPRPAQLLVVAGVVAGSLTFAAAGHGAASGRLTDLLVDAVHVMAASTWVGGLAVLAVKGRSVERRAVQQFSGVALVAVLVLTASGVVNSVVHLNRVPELWQTRYGVLLSTKVILVGAALAAAAVSRRRLHANGSTHGSVRFEALVTGVVLALTAVLTLTSPPPTVAAPATASSSSFEVGIGQGRSATLRATPPTTAGSRLRVKLADGSGRVLRPRRVTLSVSLPSRRIASIRVPLSRNGADWVGSYRFPFEGTWKATLAVEDATQTAVVAAGNLVITR